MCVCGKSLSYIMMSKLICTDDRAHTWVTGFHFQEAFNFPVSPLLELIRGQNVVSSFPITSKMEILHCMMPPDNLKLISTLSKSVSLNNTKFIAHTLSRHTWPLPRVHHYYTLARKCLGTDLVLEGQMWSSHSISGISHGLHIKKLPYHQIINVDSSL